MASSHPQLEANCSKLIFVILSAQSKASNTIVFENGFYTLVKLVVCSFGAERKKNMHDHTKTLELYYSYMNIFELPCVLLIKLRTQSTFESQQVFRFGWYFLIIM